MAGNGTAHLERGLGLRSALALNLTDMVGVGPFLTIPLLVAAMGRGALLGWIVGAGLAVCDGMIWAELGASFPQAGGSYRYLAECFGPERWGRLFSFLFVWQLSFSSPLVIATGCIGLADYAAYLWPRLNAPAAHAAAAMGVVGVALALCYRRIAWAGRAAEWLWVGVLALIGWMIVGGATHFHAGLVLAGPPGAPHVNWLLGLAPGMAIATYDYWGYENANFLGGEVARPAQVLPRAILGSIAIVAALYLAMNIGVLGVIPWPAMLHDAGLRNHLVSNFIERLYGPGAARVATLLVLWTAFASVFALLLGYSRVPFAAARDGNFFRIFGRLHPRLHIPHVALLALAAATALCCLLPLGEAIAVLVAIRLLLQSVLQAAGLWTLRRRRPDAPRPFRMWVWPWPLVAALAGFLYMLLGPGQGWAPLAGALAVLAAGAALFFARARRARTWPFGPEPA